MFIGMMSYTRYKNHKQIRSQLATARTNSCCCREGTKKYCQSPRNVYKHVKVFISYHVEIFAQLEPAFLNPIARVKISLPELRTCNIMKIFVEIGVQYLCWCRIVC